MTSILEFALSQVPGSADASVRGPHFENHCMTDSFSFRASVYSTGLGWCCFSFMKGTNSDPGKTPLELSQSCRQHQLYVPGSWQGLCPPRTGLQSLIPLIFKDFFLFSFTATLLRCVVYACDVETEGWWPAPVGKSLCWACFSGTNECLVFISLR